MSKLLILVFFEVRPVCLVTGREAATKWTPNDNATEGPGQSDGGEQSGWASFALRPPEPGQEGAARTLRQLQQLYQGIDYDRLLLFGICKIAVLHFTTHLWLKIWSMTSY